MKLKEKSIYFFTFLFLIFSCNSNETSQGDEFYNNNQFEEAIAAYNSVLENNPTNVKALYNRGRSYEELNNLDEAEKDFKAALTEDAKNIQVLLSLSNLYQKKQQHEMALQYANYAVELPGAPATAYFLKGRAYHQLGNIQNALTEYDAAIKMDPESGQTFYYRGMLKIATDKVGAGCEDLNRAVGLGHEQAKAALAQHCQ
jgi:tetratricopeptide (TPR) repeat protein